MMLRSNFIVERFLGTNCANIDMIQNTDAVQLLFETCLRIVT